MSKTERTKLRKRKMTVNEKHAADAGVAYDPRCAPPPQLPAIGSRDDVEECIRRFHTAWQLPITNEEIKPSSNDLLTATHWALDRISTLEHALRKASEKFGWLAEHHLHETYSRQAARELMEEFWRVQAPSDQEGLP